MYNVTQKLIQMRKGEGENEKQEWDSLYVL